MTYAYVGVDGDTRNLHDSGEATRVSALMTTAAMTRKSQARGVGCGSLETTRRKTPCELTQLSRFNSGTYALPRKEQHHDG